MFEQNNNLNKGLSSDYSPTKQPENTYREATNFVRLSKTGDYYSLTNELGTEVYCDLPNNYSIIGQFVLESDIILFLCANDLSSSQIGIVSSNGVYTVKLNDTSNEMNLDLDHPVDVEARVLINNNKIVYFVDNKNVIRTIDLNNPPPIGKIDKLSSLIPVANFPIIDSFEPKNSSTPLKCGAFQFVFRYINDKGNLTNVSIPSALVSIGQNSVTAGDQYQGGYSNVTASKSIILNISNIDTDYKKLEIIAINYSGESNQIVINSAAQVDISSDTLVYEYKGEILYELTIEEILGGTTNYSTAKCIAQKDGRLIISNLKENSLVEAQLQNIANQTILKYEIENLPVNSYKNGDNTAYKVGYKRGEVYSFGFGVIYKNGAKSLVYHIPAPETFGVYTPANTTTKVLGTYVSNLVYPLGQDYPSGPIRYHVMPTYAQEIPYGVFDSGSNYLINNTINLLSVVPTFPDLAEWDSIKSQIQGIFIVRRRRDSAQNTSIFSQGIANYMMDEFVINSPDGENESGSIANLGGIAFKGYNNSKKVLKKTPFLGGIRLGDYLPYRNAVGTFIWEGNFITEVGDDTAMQTSNQPLMQTFINSGNPYSTAKYGVPTTAYNTDGYDNTNQAELYKDLMVFYSPETQLLPKIEANTFTKIRVVGSSLFLDSDSLPNGTIKWDRSTYGSEDGTGDGETEMEKNSVYYAYFSQLGVDVSTYSNTPITISKNYYVPRNLSGPTEYGGLLIDNTKQEEFLLLQTATSNVYADLEITYKYFSPRNNFIGDNDYRTADFQLKNIYEVISENTAQYGSVQGQEYVICKYIPYDQDTLPDLSFYNGTVIYGGDTYITRMSFTNKTPIQSKAFMFKTSNNRWFFADTAQTDSFGVEFIDIRSNIEFFVESSKNTDLRHSLLGGNSYYRYTDVVTSLITNPEFADDVKSYNNQYDFENSLQLFYSKSDIASTGNSHYKTRTIWSDETILGELRDRYRDIRANNFYDLPFNTGEIWDNFVYANTLYLHTPKTLWKTFFNAIEQQTSTAGQVTLGTGGVFPASLPPQQVITQQGGYAGTISQWGGCNTPFGYIFPDSLQGKIFILAGNGGLEEISSNGLIRFTNDNLSVLDNLYTGYTDNPRKSNSSGLLSVYDFELKRWILVKQDPENKFTLSFDPITKQFVSTHNYFPNVFIARDNRLFGIVNSEVDLKLHEHNKGNYGEFYGTSYPSIISIVINESPNNEKVFDNIKVSAESTITTVGVSKIQAYRSTGDTLEVYNERQHSGITELVWNNTYGYLPARNEARVQLLRSDYNIKVPLNSLVSDNNPIFEANGDLILSNINQNKQFRDRIKGDYCVIRFTFSNLDNYKLTLNRINTIFRKYYR